MSGLFRDEDHRYFISATLPGGYVIGDPEPYGPLKSVTNILKALDKSGPLVGWGIRETAAAALRSLDLLKQMVAESGPEAAQKWLQARPYHLRDTAAERGTDAHQLSEAIDNGYPITDEQEAIPKVRQYRRFLAEWQPQMVGVEQMVVNLTESYAGTADRFCTIDGELWLLDIKTSNLDKSGPYEDMWLQLAGLNGGEYWGWADREDLQPAQKASRFGILQLADDHYTLWEGRITAVEFETFLQVKRTYEWLQGPLKNIKIGKAKREVAA